MSSNLTLRAHTCSVYQKNWKKVKYVNGNSSLSDTVEQIRPVTEWLDKTRTTRTGRETMVYGLYRSWINGDMRSISNTALQPRVVQYTRTESDGRRPRAT